MNEFRPHASREPRDRAPRRRRALLSELPKEECVITVADIETGKIESRYVLNPHREDTKARINRLIVHAIQHRKVVEIFAPADETALDNYSNAD